MYQVVDNLSHQAGAHALRAGVDFLFNDDTITYPALVPRHLHVLVAGELPGRHTTAASRRRSAIRSSSQTNPNVGVYAQDEWKVGSSLTLNLGLRYDLQFLETINTDTNNVSPRVGFAWSPSRVAATSSSAAAPGSSSIACRCARVANALLSAGNTTDLAQPAPAERVEPVADAGRRAGVSRTSCRRRLPSTTLVDFTTMDTNLQNAYSQQASVEVERHARRAAGRSASAISTCAASNLLMSVNQNVPTCVAAGHQQRLPADPDLREQQPVLVGAGDSNYHGLHVSFVQRPTRLGRACASATRCRSR